MDLLFLPKRLNGRKFGQDFLLIHLLVIPFTAELGMDWVQLFAQTNS